MIVLPLSGLDNSGWYALMESVAGHTLDGEAITLAHSVYRETDGNPFFVGEVLSHLAESGAMVQDAAGHWAAARPGDEIALPDSVRQVIGVRVGRLGTPATKALSVAAVIGREFDLDLTAAVAGLDEDALMELLEHARAANLVREVSDSPGRYTFNHALVQHTIYQDLGATGGHGCTARWPTSSERRVEASTGDRAAELAHHYLLASRPRRRTRRSPHARLAGETALKALAPQEALRWFAQGLELAGERTEAAEHIDLLIGLGTAQRQVGDPAFRQTLLNGARLAQESDDAERLVTPRWPTTGASPVRPESSISSASMCSRRLLRSWATPRVHERAS